MTEKILIELKGISKSFYCGNRIIEVLKGLDFTLYFGEMVAIVGKSGVGKSTLLHIIGTLDRPDHGSLIIDGIDPFSLKEKDMAVFRNRKIGFVFQFHHLLPEFSAIENVMIPAIIGGMSRKQAYARAEYLLDRVGLKDRLYHRPNELSGGEQQRVAVARALMMQPKILIADEPTGNLDETTSEDVHRLFSDLNQELGVALLVATHNMKLAESMRRIMRLEGGGLKEIA